MKTLNVIIAAFFLVFGSVALRAANLDRISAETGIPIATLQAERTSTGLGWGELENAHLLANALAAQGSNLTFNDLVAMHQAGEGWGKIAHDNGLNLGRIVSAAHRSSHATAHAQHLSTTHGKSTTAHGKSTTKIRKARATTIRGAGRNSGFKSGFSGVRGMHSMGRMGAFHGMSAMGHGGGHGR
jgi:hypothetical protein